MSLELFKTAPRKTVGVKQTLKVLQREKDRVRIVFVAQDADERVVGEIVRLAQAQGLELHYAETMTALGKACGIEVGAATAAILTH